MSTKESLERQVIAIIEEARNQTPSRSIGNKEIAKRLDVSRKKVKSLRKSVAKKLGRKPGF